MNEPGGVGVRVSYSLDQAGQELKILEENHYYPFGLKHSNYNEDRVQFEHDDVGIFAVLRPVEKGKYQYKFQGNEYQDELGINLYDFDARNYDPAIVRTLTQDPHAENYYSLSPYSFIANSPLVFVDPDGKDIYRYDEKTGKLILMKEIKEDKFDQIGKYDYNKKTKEYTLQTDKKGNAKIRVNDIAKGILKDGINFRENNNIIEVNGEGQPSEQDVIDFVVKYSDVVAKVEVSGYGLNNKGSFSEEISAMLVWKHNENRENKATDVAYNSNQLIRTLHRGGYMGNSRFAKYHYHVHPKSGQYGSVYGGNIDEASEDDNIHKIKANIPHRIFNINGTHDY